VRCGYRSKHGDSEIVMKLSIDESVNSTATCNRVTKVADRIFSGTVELPTS